MLLVYCVGTVTLVPPEVTVCVGPFIALATIGKYGCTLLYPYTLKPDSNC